jgi:hypothetical protein
MFSTPSYDKAFLQALKNLQGTRLRAGWCRQALHSLPLIDSRGSSRLIPGKDLRVPDDFPKMRIRILEIACISSIERVLSRLDDHCACAAGLLHDLIDFVLAVDVMTNREIGRAGSGL